MRFFFSLKCVGSVLVAGWAATLALAAEETGAVAPARPALLDAAFNAYLEGQQRWALTTTRSGSRDGKAGNETVIRVDPSRPYAEQYKPIKLWGHVPAEKDFKWWAKFGEDRARRRLEHAAEQTSGAHRNDEVEIRINQQLVVPELERAVVVAEDDTGVTYEIPLRKAGGSHAALFDQFELTARVNKQRREFERATFRQRSSMRVKLIAKISEGLMEIEFGSPDPQFPAVPVKITSRATVRVLFGQAHTTQSVEVCTDLLHVTPYDERFGVKLGRTRTIEL